FVGQGRVARLMIASDAVTYTEFITRINIPAGDTTLQSAKTNALRAATRIDALKNREPATGIQPEEIIGELNDLAIYTRLLVDANAPPTDPPSVIEYGPLTPHGGGTFMEASILSRNRVRGSVPSDTPLIWRNASRRPGPSPQAPMYVQGHLLNN